MSPHFYIGLAAFLFGVISDTVSVMYFYATSKNRHFLAATLSTGIATGWLYIFVEITREISIGIPYLVGVWIGTVIGVKIKNWFELPKVVDKLP
jgi:hypothetical protein